MGERVTDNKLKTILIGSKSRNRLYIVLAFILSLCYYFFIEEHPVDPLDYELKFEIIDTTSVHCGINDAELPNIEDSSLYIRSYDGRYSFYYSPEYGVAHWVAYRLTREDVLGAKVKRSSRFKPNEIIISKKWKYAINDDYYRSTYNRGHLVPSSDRLRSKVENKTTFSFANIAPQKAKFNSGVWLMIEHKIKELAVAYGELFIVVGTIVDENYNYIGVNKIAIPSHFYKCVAFRDKGEWCGVGFIIPNIDNVSDNYKDYICKINRVEKVIDLDLFPHIEKITGSEFEQKREDKFL